MAVRFHVDPGDVPAHVAARRMGLSEAQFHEKRAELEARGFPRPDATTGYWDLHAIDEWRRRRNPELFLAAFEVSQARDARAVVEDRLQRMNT